MAETKATAKAKKAVKKDVQNVNKGTAQLISDLRKLTIAELNKALIDAKADLNNAKKMLRAGELPASHVIRQMRAKVARIHTVITEKNNERNANE